MSTQETIQALMQKQRYDFGDLAAIMRVLRSEHGCPWDREQDHHSIRASLIEETYEVIEAIDNDDPVLLREELGDLLFQILFHAEIETEQQVFCVDDVVDDICKKMIHRHPHVFGTVEVSGSADVLKNWENIKTEEKQRNTLAEKLHAIPPMMPALMRASKVGKKSGRAANESAEQLLGRLSDELSLAQQRLSDTSLTEEREIVAGKLLFRLTDICRAWEVDAEYALSRVTDEWIETVAKQAEKN